MDQRGRSTLKVEVELAATRGEKVEDFWDYFEAIQFNSASIQLNSASIQLNLTATQLNSTAIQLNLAVIKQQFS